MDLQLILVIIIGLAVAIRVMLGIYRFFFSKSESGYCGSCKACEFNPDKAHDKG